jgi:hypothetical protein
MDLMLMFDRDLDLRAPNSRNRVFQRRQEAAAKYFRKKNPVSA